MSTQTTTQHTPGPWHLLGTGQGRVSVAAAVDPGWGAVATVWTGNCPEGKANAEFIVRAVNSHDAMLGVLEGLWTAIYDARAIAEHPWATAALIKAMGKAKSITDIAKGEN